MSRQHVATLWGEHMSPPFPPRLRGEDIHGIELVPLDAEVAGCVSTWLASEGDLDTGRQRILRAGLDDLRRVLVLLTDPAEHEYCSGLNQMAEAVLEAQSDPQ